MFTENHVAAGGMRMRYLEAGHGAPLVHLPGPGEPRITLAHELLARRSRVMAFALADAGPSVDALTAATSWLGLETFDLLGTSVGAAAALRLALQAPERVRTLVLEAPAAIRPEAPVANLERRLPDVAAPTLVLFGTRDEVVAPAMGRIYKELIPRCYLVFVYAAGHAISTDRPEAFAEVVGDFLERHEAFAISRARTVIHP